MSLTEKLTNIKTNLTSLLSFANEKTGRSDTDLGEAIRALADAIGSGGSGGSGNVAPFDLIGEWSGELSEYTDDVNSETTKTNIDVKNTDYMFVVITITCDSPVETTSEWGCTVCIASRYKTNSNIKTGTNMWSKGANTVNLSEAYTNGDTVNSYSCWVTNNTDFVTFTRKAHASACTKLRGGMYHVRAYGLNSFWGGGI